MLGRIIRDEMPDPIMKSLGELKVLTKEYTDQNVKIGIGLSDIKSASLSTHVALNASKFTNNGALRNDLRAIALVQEVDAT